MTYALFAIFLGACFAAGATGAMFPPGAWYRALNKPNWTPPDWLFPVAWTTLYLCMAAAAARVHLTLALETQVPPAASILDLAEAENIWAVTESFLLISP